MNDLKISNLTEEIVLNSTKWEALTNRIRVDPIYSDH